MLLVIACSTPADEESRVRDGGPPYPPSVSDAGEPVLLTDGGADSTDGGTDPATDGGVDPTTPDGGIEEPSQDAGPLTTLTLLSEAPEYAIAGIEYRYFVAVDTNAEDVDVVLVDGPMGASVDAHGRLSWTPANGAPPADFTLRLDAGDVSLEQSFSVQVATPVPLASQMIDRRLGGTITVTSTATALAGVRVRIPANTLPTDLEITIAALTGPVEPVAAGHTELLPPFVVLPQVPGARIEVTIPKPINLVLGADELALMQTAVANPPLQAGARGRFQDMVVTLDDVAPAEATFVRSELDQAARYIRLVSGRYLRLEGPNTRLYWNLAAGAAPPTADAERAISTAEQTIEILSGVGFGCRMPSRVAIFVVDFTQSWSGFAYRGALYLQPSTVTATPLEMRYVMAHELVHVAQSEMLPGRAHDRVSGWWVEAMATHGADEVFDDDVWTNRYGFFTQRLVTKGLTGDKTSLRAYQLALFLKHLDATQRFRFCRIMALHPGALIRNEFDVALQGSTGTDAVKHLSTFAAAYSAHRQPTIVEDIDKVAIQFSPTNKVLQDVPITVRFNSIAGAQAVVVSSPNPGPITVVARRLSSSGAGALVSFYAEDGGNLVDLGDLVDGELVIEDAPNPFTMVAASSGLSAVFSEEIELTEGLRINGIVQDISGEPVRAHLALDEQPMVEAYSTLEDGRFGLTGVNSSTNERVTVRATCALDPNLTATTVVGLSTGTTIDAGTLQLPGECPSIEILSPRNGATVAYGPYLVSGLTNLSDDRLSARVNLRSSQQTQLATRPASRPGLRAFEGRVANDWMDEGEHTIAVFSTRTTAHTEVMVTKALPRTFGALSRSDGCGGTCPRVVTAKSPFAVAEAREACRRSSLEACADRLDSCTTEVLGGSTMPSGGRVRFHYEQTMVCSAADCEWTGNRESCDGEPFDLIWDANALREIYPGQAPRVSAGVITEGFDCAETVGRAVYTASECPEEFNAYCSFEFSYDPCTFCGDGQCGAFEPDRCPADCGSCGDGVCSPDGLESAVTCSVDCGSCGDGICAGPMEDTTNCAADCACGNGVCDPSEVRTCTEDCG